MKRAATLATGLLLVAFASTAPAKIVPQQGIAGMSLGMSVDRVLHKKGKPDGSFVRNTQAIGKQRVLRYGKTTALFAGADDDAELIGVVTRDPSERTAGNTGIGTAETVLEADLPRLECKNIFGGRHCLIGKVKRGRTVTDFLISRKTRLVKRVTVAIITD